MSSRSESDASAAADATPRLREEVARLGQWQADHDKECARRYAELGRSVEKVEESIKGLARDIGRIHSVLLKAPAEDPAPLPAPPRRSRIELTKDLVQIVFQTVTGLGLLLWVAGRVLSWLGAKLELLSSGFPKH